MTDEQTIRRVMHQKRKDQHKVSVFELKHELARQTKLTKFFRVVNWTLMGLMIAVFVSALVVLENNKISVGEKAIHLLQQKGVIEK